MSEDKRADPANAQVPESVPPELRHLYVPGGPLDPERAKLDMAPRLAALDSLDAWLLPALADCGVTVVSWYPVRMAPATLVARRHAARFVLDELGPLWRREEIEVRARAERLGGLLSLLVVLDVTVSAARVLEFLGQALPAQLEFQIADAMSRARIAKEPATIEWLEGVLLGERDELFGQPSPEDLWCLKAVFGQALARLEPTARTVDLLAPLMPRAPLLVGYALRRVALSAARAPELLSRTFEVLTAEVALEAVARLSAEERRKFERLVQGVRVKAHPRPRLIG